MRWNNTGTRAPHGDVRTSCGNHAAGTADSLAAAATAAAAAAASASCFFFATHLLGWYTCRRTRGGKSVLQGRQSERQRVQRKRLSTCVAGAIASFSLPPHSASHLEEAAPLVALDALLHLHAAPHLHCHRSCSRPSSGSERQVVRQR